jgi:hypothetical protein
MRRNTASSSASRLTVTRCRPASFSGTGLARQQAAVGGEGQVERLSLGAAQPSQLFDEARQVATQQGLAAGQAQLAHAQAHEHPGQAGDFLEAEQRCMRQELETRTEMLLGHAVGAAEVAAVGDRDAQIAQGSLQGVKRFGGVGVGHGDAARQA